MGIAVSLAAHADFTYSLEPSAIQPGQRATLVLRLPESDLLAGSTSEDVFPEAQDDALIKSNQWELLEQDYRKERGEYVWKYSLTAYATGEFSIPPIAVTLGPQSFSTERKTLTVLSDRTADDQELRPDAGPVSVPIDWSFWGGILLAGAAAVLAYRNRHRIPLPKLPERKRAEAPAPIEKPADWLRKQLLILRAKIDAQPTDPYAPDSWSEILREFARRKMHVPVPAWTTREMFARLKDDPKFIELAALFEQCDAFKFSSDRDGHKSAQSSHQTLHWIQESERLFL